MVHQVELDFGGRTLRMQTGKLPSRLRAAVSPVCRHGRPLRVVFAQEENPNATFLPCTSTIARRPTRGRIPGGFFKREGRPNEKETTSARLVDRALRPFFDENIRNEITVSTRVSRRTRRTTPTCSRSSPPRRPCAFRTCPSPARSGRARGQGGRQLVLNPTFPQLVESTMDLVFAGTRDSIIMTEGETREVSESEFIEAAQFAQTRSCACRAPGTAHRPGAGAEAPGAHRDPPEGIFARSRALRRRRPRGDGDAGQAAPRRTAPPAPARGPGGFRRAVPEAGWAVAKASRNRVPPRAPAGPPERRRADAAPSTRSGRSSARWDCCAHPRLGALPARGDPGDGRDHLGTSMDEQRIEELEGQSGRPSCCTTTSPATASGGAALPRPLRRRSATARSPSGRLPRSSLERELPVHHPHRLGHPRVERLVFDGHRVRRQPVAHGCRCPIKSAVAGVAMGLITGDGKYEVSPISRGSKTIWATWI